MTQANPQDRRSRTKEEFHRRIITAAHELVAESEGTRFGVDELAARADVSRRTIFNHFASIDDVITTACTEAIGVVIESFRASVAAPTSAGPTRSTMFDHVARALRLTDVPGIVAYLWKALGGFDELDPRPQQIIQAAFARTATDLAEELSARYPGTDRLEAELLVSSVMHGAGVIARHWILESGAAITEETRLIWDRLRERLLSSVRLGYLPSS